MFKEEYHDDSSGEEKYILPDLCEEAAKKAYEESYREPVEHFMIESPHYISSEDDDTYILPDQLNHETEDTLPEKSKKLYKETYMQFLKWIDEKEIKLYSENVLLEYFKELSTKMSAISLWPKYSMLRAMIKQENNIDIKNYNELRLFLKKLNIGRCKKAKTFTSEEMKKFLTEAPDEQNLDLKVILIIGVSGSCRRKELHDLRINHVTDINNQLIISFPDATTHVKRIFAVNDALREIVIKYMNLRPKDIEDDHFFLNYQKGGCTKQLIGINKIGGMPQKIAAWLKLPHPKLYTGHSFRRTSASSLAQAAVNIDLLEYNHKHLTYMVPNAYRDQPIIKSNICNQTIEDSQSKKSNKVDEKSYIEPVEYFKVEYPDYSSEDNNYILPDQNKATVYETIDTLPEKSKKLYKQTYRQFIKWMEEKETKSYSENILLEYFKELSTKMFAISLLPKYSMLKAMIKQEKNIDIKNYNELRLFLKELTTGVKCKKTKTFTSEEMKKFLTEAPDEQNLDLKVILIIGVTGSCRRKELHNLRISHVTDVNNQLIISFPDAMTHVIKTFIVNNTLREIVIKYMNLRPKDIEDDHFFLNYQNGRCSKRLIGINKIGGIPQKIARWLKLPYPKLYTGYSFLRTSAALLADSIL